MFLLIIGGVYALTSLSDTLKVEKVGDVYSVYVLKEQKTTNDIKEEKSHYLELIEEMNINEDYEKIYEQCINNVFSICEDKDAYVMEPFTCEEYYTHICNDYRDWEIIEKPIMKEVYQQEINKLDELLKVK